VTRRTRDGEGFAEERYSTKDDVAGTCWKLSKLTSVNEGYCTAGAASNSGIVKSCEQVEVKLGMS